MCGIAGIVSTNKPLSEIDLICRSMLTHILPRGPDDSKKWVEPGIGLTHSRLSIIGEGAQPMQSPDGRYTIIYNGEIVNYKELRKDLVDDFYFQTNSDTEVLLAAYIKWGEACLTHLNGMFSFFVWDSTLKKGFSARDLMGIKPFYYTNQNGNFIFSSEISAILDALPEKVINDEYIWEYWINPAFPSNDNTPFKDVFSLPGGHSITLSNGEVKISQWKDYVIDIQHHQLTSSLHDELEDTVINACQDILKADCPITSYLSGGLDSSLITCLASKHLSTFDECFTVHFNEQKSFSYKDSVMVKSNDFPFAEKVAEYANISLNQVNVSEESIAQCFSEIASINSMIPLWEQEITHYHMAKQVSKYYKVTLVGDVADETHYGYHFLLSKGLISSPTQAIKRFQNARLSISDQKKTDIFDNMVSKIRETVTKANHHWRNNTKQLLATTYMINKYWLPRLLINADVYPMRFGLEARVPFADTRLLEITRKINPTLALKGGIEKYCLKQVAKGKIPDAIISRQKSSLPKHQQIDRTYQKILRKIIANTRALDTLSQYLDTQYLNELANTPTLFSEQEKSFLFKVISFSYWHKHHFNYIGDI